MFTLDVGQFYEPNGQGLCTIIVVYGVGYPSACTRMFFYNY